MGELNYSLKELSISLGCYRAARFLQRQAIPSRRRKFNALRNLLSEFIQPGQLVFDIGANLGQRTELFLSLGAKVVAFEPQPKCAREIRANDNGKLTVIEKAVGATTGSGQFHLKAANTHSSFLPDWPGGGPTIKVLTVPITTLDAAISEFGRPSFVKIDVEGFELEVFRGLSQLIPAFCFEYHCDEWGTKNVFDCLRSVSELGHLQINMIGEDDGEWLLDHWACLDEFPTVFSKYARHFGDVFVKIATASSKYSRPTPSATARC
jgi:FkbM family methyltransferase